MRVSSAAFRNDSDAAQSPMSVFLGDTLIDEDRPFADALIGHADFCLMAITAQDARAQQQAVVRDPLPTESAHGLVVGKKNKPISQRLASTATWIIPATAPALPAG